MNRNLLKSLNTEYFVKEYANGFKLYLVKKKNFKSNFVAIATNFGGRDHSLKIGDQIVKFPGGFAHFFEHKLFEDENQIDSLVHFNKAGAYSNAFTSENMTFYYFKTIVNFEENLKILLKMFENFDVSQNSIDKEKKIIIEEMKMYDNYPSSRYFDHLMTMLFNSKHDLSNNIIGNSESINATSLEELQTCFKYQYDPKNLSMIIISDQDEKYLESLIDNSFISQVNFSELKSQRVYYPEYPLIAKAYDEISLDNLATDINIIGLRYNSEDYKFNSKAIIILQLLQKLTMTKLSIDYKERLANKEIGINYDYYNFLDRDGFYSLLFNNGDDFTSLEKDIEKIINLQLTEEELSSYKKAIYAKKLLEMEDSYNLAVELISESFDGANFDDIFNDIMNISLSDIHKVQTMIKDSQRVKLLVRKKDV